MIAIADGAEQFAGDGIDVASNYAPAVMLSRTRRSERVKMDNQNTKFDEDHQTRGVVGAAVFSGTPEELGWSGPSFDLRRRREWRRGWVDERR
jgi:hypothetical protein